MTSKKKTSRKPAAQAGEQPPPDEMPEVVAEQPEEPMVGNRFQQLAHEAEANATLLSGDLAAVGEAPVRVDRTKEAIKIAVPWGERWPSEQHPDRGTFVSVFCQPLTNGHHLILYRDAEMYMANQRSDVEARADENGNGGPKDHGAVIITSGSPSYTRGGNRYSTSGFEINKNGFRFVFCTVAARKIFEALGTPFEDEESLTSLKAQAQGSTLLDALRKESGQLHREQRAARSAAKAAVSGAQPYVRPTGAPAAQPVQTSGPAGTQNVFPEADFDE